MTEASIVAVEAKRLAELSPTRSAAELALTWVQLAAIIGVVLYIDSIWAIAAGALLVGARQYGLLILLHDGSHGLLHPSRKVNDAICLWLIAAPCGSSFWNSRATHLMHHRFLGEPRRDPDYFLYCAGEPAPKATPLQLAWHFCKMLLGGRVFHSLFGGGEDASDGRRASPIQKVRALIPVASIQLLLLALFTLAGHPFAYFYLWVLPLVTLAVLFDSLRVFCDHSVPLGAPTHADALLVSYVSTPLERFFFAPFDMNYHAEHHFFPYVPHYNLARLRELLRSSPEHRDRIQWRRGYVGYMLGCLPKDRRPVPAGTL